MTVTRFKLFLGFAVACWLGLVLTFAWPAIAGSFGGGAGSRNTTVTGTVTVDSITAGDTNIGNFDLASGGIPTASFTAPTASGVNCAVLGTTAVTAAFAAGTYLVTVADETVFYCDSDDGGSGTDCATLGTPLVAGTQIVIRTTAATTGYCRSAGATGDIRFTALTYP